MKSGTTLSTVCRRLQTFLGNAKQNAFGVLLHNRSCQIRAREKQDSRCSLKGNLVLQDFIELFEIERLQQIVRATCIQR